MEGREVMDSHASARVRSGEEENEPPASPTNFSRNNLPSMHTLHQLRTLDGDHTASLATEKQVFFEESHQREKKKRRKNKENFAGLSQTDNEHLQNSLGVNPLTPQMDHDVKVEKFSLPDLSIFSPGQSDSATELSSRINTDDRSAFGRGNDETVASDGAKRSSPARSGGLKPIRNEREFGQIKPSIKIALSSVRESSPAPLNLTNKPAKPWLKSVKLFLARYKVTIVYSLRCVINAVVFALCVSFFAQAASTDFYDCMGYFPMGTGTHVKAFAKLGTFRSFSGNFVVHHEFFRETNGRICPDETASVHPEIHLNKVKIANIFAISFAGANTLIIVAVLWLRKAILLKDRAMILIGSFCISLIQTGTFVAVLVLLRSKAGWPVKPINSTEPYPYMGGMYNFKICYEVLQGPTQKVEAHVLTRTDQHLISAGIALSLADAILALVYMSYRLIKHLGWA